MSKVEEIKSNIKKSKENIFSKAIENKNYSLVFGFFVDEITEFCNEKIPLQIQIESLKDSIEKAGFKNFDIPYRTYQQYVRRSIKDKNQKAPALKKTVVNTTPKEEVKNPNSTVDNMEEALSSFNL